jgi:hypothetical protein
MFFFFNSLIDDGLVTVLEQLPVPPVATVEPDGIAGEQAAHETGDTARSGPKKKMGMVAHQGPGIAHGLGFRDENAQPVNKIDLIDFVTEYFLSLNPPNDHMVEHTGSIYSG